MNTKTKIRKTNNSVLTFNKTTIKNFNTMKSKLKKIWLCMLFIAVAAVIQSCNVTRRVTTESTYYQKGDTCTTITVKTVESYDATKKGM